ncbi:MAG TPA: hypothetical protein VJJ77_05090 [Dongiaceae bacterium]|nr:hypothetical protein [Dongiaceae bacterium]
MTFVPPDASNLGPPPRELRPEWWRYCKKRAPAGSLVLAILFGVLAFGMLPAALIVPNAFTIGQTVLWFAAMVAAIAVRRSIARRMAYVIQHGALTAARVTHRYVVPTRRGPDRCDLVVQVGERSVRFSTHDPSLGNLMQVGLDVEILCHPDQPDVVVPTFDLPGA